MAEFGMVAAQRNAGLKVLIAIIADGDDVRLPPMARELLVLQVEHLRQIEARIAALDGRLVRQARDDEACRRLTEAPGIGPVIASAMVATVGNARLFSSGRSFAAWLGLILDDGAARRQTPRYGQPAPRWDANLHCSIESHCVATAPSPARHDGTTAH
jgi:transposase